MRVETGSRTNAAPDIIVDINGITYLHAVDPLQIRREIYCVHTDEKLENRRTSVNDKEAFLGIIPELHIRRHVSEISDPARDLLELLSWSLSTPKYEY